MKKLLPLLLLFPLSAFAATWTISWQPVTTWDDGTPVTPKHYIISWRENNCYKTPGCTAVENWTDVTVTTPTLTQTFTGDRCYIIQAIGPGGEQGLTSEIGCTDKTQHRTPKTPTGIRLTRN